MDIPNVKESRSKSELKLAKELLEYASTYLCGSYANKDKVVDELVNEIEYFLYGKEE